MNWNNIPNGERLRLWKKFRTDIVDFTYENKLEAIAKFCADMPIGHRSVDYYTSSSWPTPWEILFHGTFCSSSISLLVFHTVHMLDINNHTYELILVEDTDVYLLPLIDGQFVLNYESGVVNRYLDIKDSFKVLKTFSLTDIITIQ